MRSRFRIITTLWKNVSIGQLFSWSEALAGRSTSVPPRQRSAGVAFVRPGLLADDAAEQRFELDGTVHGHLDDQGGVGALAIGDDRKRIAGARRRRLGSPRGADGRDSVPRALATSREAA